MPSGTALWNLGFRPFFLLAGAFATLDMLAWVVPLTGATGGRMLVDESLWHAHEMIFGYAFAVVVGFLFTAVRNWTNEPTPTGRTLMAIAVLWLAGRALGLTPWRVLAVVADSGFALAAVAGIAVPLWKSRNRRNYFFVALLAALGAADLVFHLATVGAIDIAVGRWLRLALDLVLFIMAVMGGRVIPMFTANAVVGARPVRSAWVERIALGSLLALIVADVAALAAGIVAGIAACAHAARLLLWQPWLTARRPILWILHASYAWIVAYLALRVLSAAGLVPAEAAVHALTVGAIGGLTLGMMTRVARGHTGRPLEASAPEVVAYAAIQLAALVRVIVPLALPQWYHGAVIGSGLLWSAAFALFTAAFWPVLVRPRVDGRPG